MTDYDDLLRGYTPGPAPVPPPPTPRPPEPYPPDPWSPDWDRPAWSAAEWIELLRVAKEWDRGNEIARTGGKGK